MGWPTCEMCTSSRYWKGCRVGKVPAPGGSDSHVPSIQDSGSSTGFILGASEDRRRERQRLLPAVPAGLCAETHTLHWAGPSHYSLPCGALNMPPATCQEGEKKAKQLANVFLPDAALEPGSTSTEKRRRGPGGQGEARGRAASEEGWGSGNARPHAR